MGAVIAPPLPGFYSHPRTIDDVVNETVSRLLDLFDVHLDVAARWEGTMAAGGGRRRPARPRPSRARSGRG